jgi:hypothetical protein
MFFYSLNLKSSKISVGLSYLLTECAEQFALAVECSGRRDIDSVRRWLDNASPVFVPLLWHEEQTVHLTERLLRVLQQNLNRALYAVCFFPSIFHCCMRSKTPL